MDDRAVTRLQPRQRKTVAVWLLGLCLMVLAMVVLGGVTRLTHSGLSMVEWRPLTGWFPPLTEVGWEEEFARYREFPEYRLLNFGMTLADFKGIYWLEYLHRLWGRLIGAAFLIPLVVFVWRRWLAGRLLAKLVGVFVLGGLQGALGWYMVQSGLADQPDVSHYRLTAHLGLALVVYGMLLWLALDLLQPAPRSPPSPALRRWAATFAGVVALTALSGGLVAGLDAGFIYNTFPLMEGRLVPEEAMELTPWYLNLVENIATVQFDHRLLALATLAFAVALWLRFRRQPLAAEVRRALGLSVLMAALQVALGVATLLLYVPVTLAAAHQGGAVVLFSFALWTLHAAQPIPSLGPQGGGAGSP